MRSSGRLKKPSWWFAIFRPPDLDLFIKILHQLGDHLGRARRIRFVVKDYSIVDVSDHLSMMVDHDNRMTRITMEAYQRKAKLVANAQVYKGCAIAWSTERDDTEIQVTAAQAADDL